ncbi:hypothetical protein HanPI659440_Chr16g0634141 [Helianthus annuus]|nr:hypothetical protein HanPI659440_Chr16g0634141 [Helianthus annuus]
MKGVWSSAAVSLKSEVGVDVLMMAEVVAVLFRVTFKTRFKARFECRVSRISSFLAPVVMRVNSVKPESTRVNTDNSVNSAVNSVQIRQGPVRPWISFGSDIVRSEFGRRWSNGSTSGQRQSTKAAARPGKDLIDTKFLFIQL